VSRVGLPSSELAHQADVPVMTVCYYERIELLRAPDRQDNGYRSTTSQRAEHTRPSDGDKRMGSRWTQVPKLIELQPSGRCGPVQEQIREFLAEGVVEVRGQRKEKSAFRAQLKGYGPHRQDGTGDRFCKLDCERVHSDEAIRLAVCERFPDVAREARSAARWSCTTRRRVAPIRNCLVNSWHKRRTR
jgi:DNA-binding transcriptional MerR regulator